MVVGKRNSIDLGRHQEVFKVPYIGKTVSFIRQQCQKRDQSAIITNPFSTACERQVRLFANTTPPESIAATLMISALSQCSAKRNKTFANTFPHLQIVFNSLHTAKAAGVETSWVPLKIFEYRERRLCHDRSITMTKVIELLIRMRRHIAIVCWTK